MLARAATASMPGYHDTSNERSSQNVRSVAMRSALQGRLDSMIRALQAER